MRRQLVALLACLVVPAIAEAQTIAYASGSLTQGTTITYSGSSLGSGAVPDCYDDFQSVTLNANISTSTSCSWANPTSNDTNPIADNTNLRSGTPFTRNMRSRWTQPGGGGQSSSSVRFDGHWSGKWMIDAYFYIDPSGASAGWTDNGNWKPFRLHTVNIGNPSFNWGFAGQNNGTGQMDGSTQPNCIDQSFPGKASSYFYSRWNHATAMIDAGTGGGNADGAGYAYLDSVLQRSQTSCSTTSPSWTEWAEAHVGNYVRTGDYTGTITMWWESVYIAPTHARLYLCDASPCTSGTHSEIQPIVTWSATAITARLNRGSFASNASVYPCVYTNANAAACGSPITLGAGGGGGLGNSTRSRIRLRVALFVPLVLGLVLVGRRAVV